MEHTADEATINGVTLSTSQTNRYEQGLFNNDLAATGQEFFQVYEDNLVDEYYPTNNSSTYRNDWIGVYFFDYLIEFAPGDWVPTSSFSWTNGIGFGGSGGAINLLNYVYDYDTGTYRSYSYSRADWILESLRLGPQIVEVPEPSAIALFGVGLAGLGWMSRRRLLIAGRRGEGQD